MQPNLYEYYSPHDCALCSTSCQSPTDSRFSHQTQQLLPSLLEFSFFIAVCFENSFGFGEFFIHNKIKFNLRFHKHFSVTAKILS